INFLLLCFDLLLGHTFGHCFSEHWFDGIRQPLFKNFISRWGTIWMNDNTTLTVNLKISILLQLLIRFINSMQVYTDITCYRSNGWKSFSRNNLFFSNANDNFIFEFFINRNI